MRSLNIIPFDCSRTCPQAGEKACRFSSIFSLLGPWVVNSHTVTVKVEYKDIDMLRRAVLAVGGIWYGQGKHDLLDTIQEGYGFRLPMERGVNVDQSGKSYWYHPIVLRGDGQLAYDDYGGAWGDKAQLDRLQVSYTVSVCEQAAMNQGWQCERINGGVELLVYHPSGGTMTVTQDGKIDAAGFVGHGCHDAIQSLGLPILESQIKPEYSQVAAEVHVSC